MHGSIRSNLSEGASHPRGSIPLANWHFTELGKIILNIAIRWNNGESFEYYYKNKKHKYLPDFVVNNVIYEIKGFKTELSDIKMNSVLKTNHAYEILYKKDMRFYLEYVHSKYKENILNLYDGIFPQYDYKCFYCGKDFSSLKKKKKKIVFCLDNVSGKHRAKINHK